LGQWEERLLNGKSFVTFDFKGRAGQTTAKGVTLTEGFNLHPIPQIAADGKTPYQMTSPVVSASRAVALSSKVKDPELAIKFLDYLYSDEGTDFTELGILGETYEIVDGSPRLLESLGADFINVLRRDYGVVYDAVRTGPDKFSDAAMHMRNELDQATEELYKDNLQPPPNVISKSEAEIEFEKEKLLNLEKYLDEKLTEFVMGRVPINEQTVADFLRQCDLLGASELVEMYNRLYKG